ncbi:MAG: hypothetical protein RLZZ126_2081 [Pseudomonadota bacterium]|jgi:heme exporter protein D
MSGAAWERFWSMGGYGMYVWGSYALCMVALVVEAAWARAKYRRTLQEATDRGEAA